MKFYLYKSSYTILSKISQRPKCIKGLFLHNFIIFIFILSVFDIKIIYVYWDIKYRYLYIIICNFNNIKCPRLTKKTGYRGASQFLRSFFTDRKNHVVPYSCIRIDVLEHHLTPTVRKKKKYVECIAVACLSR